MVLPAHSPITGKMPVVPSEPNSMRFSIVVPLILLSNVLIYLAWNLSGDPAGTFARHFLVSFDALREGRIWTLWTSEFSHVAFLHLFLNMFVLWQFGRLLELVLGPLRFLAFYLFAAALASLGHAVLSAFLLGDPALNALGASGAVSGILIVFGLMFPRQKILLFGIIPLPAIFAAFAMVGLDLWGLYRQAHGSTLPIGHGAHLGGALAGLLYWFFRLRGRRLR